ncbi:hypothetical protein MMC17_002313 [Xylographa soralifera]|nr:hypothetical protein [Xylographa soralifera]
MSQAPPLKMLPPNVTMKQWNVFSAVPDDLKAQYDIVHVRLLVFVIKDNPLPVLLNLLALLNEAIIFRTLLKWQLTPPPVFVENFDDASTFPRDAADLFLNGMNSETIEEARQHLVRHPMASFTTQTKGTGWRGTPATYVVTLQDHAVPKIYQDIMLARVKKEGVELRIETYDTCHSIFLTKQKEMVELVAKAVRDERNPQ